MASPPAHCVWTGQPPEAVVALPADAPHQQSCSSADGHDREYAACSPSQFTQWRVFSQDSEVCSWALHFAQVWWPRQLCELWPKHWHFKHLRGFGIYGLTRSLMYPASTDSGRRLEPNCYKKASSEQASSELWKNHLLVSAATIASVGSKKKEHIVLSMHALRTETKHKVC
nr:uncharacterized protein LOC129380894 [Dermacentor andersoni]